MLLLQCAIWLISLSVATSRHLVRDRNHRFTSRHPVSNFSTKQCPTQISTCSYFNYYGTKVFSNHTLLRAGFCATCDEHTSLVTFSVFYIVTLTNWGGGLQPQKPPSGSAPAMHNLVLAITCMEQV